MQYKAILVVLLVAALTAEFACGKPAVHEDRQVRAADGPADRAQIGDNVTTLLTSILKAVQDILAAVKLTDGK